MFSLVVMKNGKETIVAQKEINLAFFLDRNPHTIAFSMDEVKKVDNGTITVKSLQLAGRTLHVIEDKDNKYPLCVDWCKKNRPAAPARDTSQSMAAASSQSQVQPKSSLLMNSSDMDQQRAFAQSTIVTKQPAMMAAQPAQEEPKKEAALELVAEKEESPQRPIEVDVESVDDPQPEPAPVMKEQAPQPTI